MQKSTGQEKSLNRILRPFTFERIMRKSPHEKANPEVRNVGKQESTETANKHSGERYATKRKISERAKSGEMPKAVQRASPLALAFPFCDLTELRRRALVWRSEATPLV